MGAASPKFQKILQTQPLKQIEKNCDNLIPIFIVNIIFVDVAIRNPFPLVSSFRNLLGSGYLFTTIDRHKELEFSHPI